MASFRAVVTSEAYDQNNERRFRADVENTMLQIEKAMLDIVSMRGEIASASLRVASMMAPVGIKIHG